MIRKPGFAEFNVGALAGVMTGSMLGLFAPGLPPAILDGNLGTLFDFKHLGMISFCLCGAVGWVLGGQLGPWLGRKFQRVELEVGGGVVGGLIPAAVVIGWAFYMVLH